jgi:CHC2 zinc finger
MFVDKQSITTSRPLRVNKIVVVRFAKDKLPPALSFYEAELGKLTRPNQKGWCAGRCPFHQSKSGKSFAVHIEGAFVCRGCGVKGHDLIAFLRLRDGLTFKEACQELGAWDDAGRPTMPPVMVPVKYLTFDYRIAGLHYSASVEDEPRNYAGLVRGFYRAAGAQLTALGPEKTESDEAETCWTRLTLGLGELREIGIL